jgi:hypothetical protein
MVRQNCGGEFSQQEGKQQNRPQISKGEGREWVGDFFHLIKILSHCPKVAIEGRSPNEGFVRQLVSGDYGCRGDLRKC